METRSDAGVDAPTSIRAFDDCLNCQGVFTPSVEYCAPNDACSTLRACFHLTFDLAVCGLAAPRAATACGNGVSSHPNDCGCNGLACRADQACVQVYDYPLADARDAGTYNTCVDYHNNGRGGLEILGVRCVYADADSPPSGLDPSWCAGTRVVSLRSLGNRPRHPLPHLPRPRALIARLFSVLPSAARVC